MRFLFCFLFFFSLQDSSGDSWLIIHSFMEITWWVLLFARKINNSFCVSHKYILSRFKSIDWSIATLVDQHSICLSVYKSERGADDIQLTPQCTQSFLPLSTATNKFEKVPFLEDKIFINSTSQCYQIRSVCFEHGACVTACETLPPQGIEGPANETHVQTNSLMVTDSNPWPHEITKAKTHGSCSRQQLNSNCREKHLYCSFPWHSHGDPPLPHPSKQDQHTGT